MGRPRSQPADGRIRVARLPPTTDRNPYQRLLYRHLADHGVELIADGDLSWRWLLTHRQQVDLLHLHWRLDRLVTRRRAGLPAGPPPHRPPWRAALGGLALTTRLAAARSLGYRIAWTVHEPGRMDREREAISWWTARAVARQSDLVFAFDEQSAAAVRPWLCAGVEPIVTGFPSYAEAHPPGARTPPLRHELGIDDETFVFLCLGHQRADKDLPLLLDAFSRVPDPVALVVAGKADDERCHDLLTQAGSRDPRVTYLPGHVPDDDLRWVLDSADTAVLARSREWTPSSLVLAQASGVPSIAADLPTSRVHLGPGAWLFTPGDASSLADAMTRAAADRDAARRRGEAGRRFVDRQTWPDTVAVTAAAFHALGVGTADTSEPSATPAPSTATARS